MGASVLQDGRPTGGRIIHPRDAPFSLTLECFLNTADPDSPPVWSPRDMTGCTASLYLGATVTQSLDPVVSGADDNVVTLSLTRVESLSASGSVWEVKTAGGVGVAGGDWAWASPGETRSPTSTDIITGGRVLMLESEGRVTLQAATAQMPAAAILAELLAVDGAGSGLDADLLDGQSSAHYATAAALAASIDALTAADVGAVRGTTTDSSSGGVNSVAGASVNSIGGGSANTISGGGTTGDPNTITGGIVNVIGGGYDNTISASGVGANTMAGGAHHVVDGNGSHCTVGGGSYNALTNSDYGTIGGGTQNSVTADLGTIAGGSGNTASGQNATVIGGANCVASGNYAIAGGLNCAASGLAAIALGRNAIASGVGAVALGRNCTAAGNHSLALGDGAHAGSVGSLVLASGSFAAIGDAEASFQVMRELTTTATTQTMDLAFVPQPSSTFAYRLHLVAREPSTGASRSWEMRGLAKRDAASLVTLVGGAPTPTVIAGDTGTTTWAVTVLAGTGTFNVRVTGEAGKTIRWVALVELVEVAG
jgi:hypothetical protein